MLAFAGIFGSGGDQIPLGSTINSATLTVRVTNGSTTAGAIGYYNMLMTWDETATYANSFGGNGIQRNNVEASSSVITSYTPLTNTTVSRNVTSSLSSWAGGSPNFGWAIMQTGNSANGSTLASSEHTTTSFRPTLVVDFDAPVVPEAHTGIPLLLLWLAAGMRGLANGGGISERFKKRAFRKQ